MRGRPTILLLFGEIMPVLPKVDDLTDKQDSLSGATSTKSNPRTELFRRSIRQFHDFQLFVNQFKESPALLQCANFDRLLESAVAE